MLYFLLCIHLCVGSQIPVQDCTALQGMSLDGNYVLTKNIDCRGVDFVPVGTATAPFTGGFDGGFFTISSLSITQLGQSYVGLFGNVYGATIKNVAITLAKINGNAYTGVLAGLANATTISNVVVSGNLLCGPYGGGLVGVFALGKIMNASAAVTVISNGATAGGLVGAVISSNIMRCATTGTTSASCQDPGRPVGGLVGSINGTKDLLSFITESSATGAVSAACTFVGGLVGSADSRTTVQNCYSTSAVSSSSDNLQSPGGIFGSANGALLVFGFYAGKSSCKATSFCYSGGLYGCYSGTAPGSSMYSYYNSDLTAQVSCGGPGNTTAQMMETVTYENWDFQTTWGIHPNKSYPYLLLE